MFSMSMFPSSLRHKVRHYSRYPKVLKLWVVHNSITRPIQVSMFGRIKGRVRGRCVNVDDFARKVQRDLGINQSIDITISPEFKPIAWYVKIRQLLKTPEFKNNSAKSPLYAINKPDPDNSGYYIIMFLSIYICWIILS